MPRKRKNTTSIGDGAISEPAGEVVADDHSQGDEDDDDDDEDRKDTRTSRLRKRDAKRNIKALTANTSAKITPKGRNNSRPAQKKFTPKSQGKTPKSADHNKQSVSPRHKLDSLGLGADFEQNEKTADYFRNVEIDELINEKCEHVFDTLSRMKRDLLEPVNKKFGDDPPCILTSTPNYVRLMCKYSNCPFQIWYTYTQKGSATEPSKIKFFRKINNNHSFDCHKKAVHKDKKVVIL